MNDSIVFKGLKVDFHIHSAASHKKDGKLVSFGTKENIDVLLNKLKENNIDAFAITDHDCFDKELYLELKKREGVDFKKIFPGVEFSLGLTSDDGKIKEIHVIAVFDDSCQQNIDKIADALPTDNINYDLNNSYFSESKFRDILSQIGVAAVLIAHQKNSEYSGSPQKRDVSSLGKERFNELINIEYFDAFEFKTPRQHIFHSLFRKEINSETYEKVKHLTGSDCHQWGYYPHYDATDCSEFYPTFLKCLPTFRGLVMSVTDVSRISGNGEFFDKTRKSLDSISLTIHGREVVIPLSKGINVVIGDNSIGKSLLLHALTGYKKILEGNSGLNKDLKQKYDNFLSNNCIKIDSRISDGDYTFDVQGGIRHLFEGKNFFSSFSKDKFPKETDSTLYKSFVNNHLEQCFELLRIKFEYDQTLADLPTIMISNEPEKMNFCSVKSCPPNAINKKSGLSKIIKSLKAVQIENEKLLTPGYLDDDENKKIKDYNNYIKNLLNKYSKLKEMEDNQSNVFTALSSGIQQFNEYVSQIRSKEETDFHSMEEAEQSISINIAKLVSLKHKIKKYDFAVDKPLEVVCEHSDFGDVSFVSSFSTKTPSINKTYLRSVVERVLLKNKIDEFDTSIITESELTLMIADAGTENGKTGLDLLKAKISGVVDSDFSVENSITVNGEYRNTYSAGFNAKEYFYLLSYDLNKRDIYIVDQPEDDVSQTSIATDIIPCFRRLRDRRQIILVTHNPQFVVNIDADNVIYIFKEGEKINIINGALEFKDNKFDILSLIENTLDGGEESIKKRWKRYEKTS